MTEDDLFNGEPGAGDDTLRPVEPIPQMGQGEIPVDRTRIYAFNHYERGRQGKVVSSRLPMEWCADIQRQIQSNPEYEELWSAYIRDSVFHRMIDHNNGGVMMSPATKSHILSERFRDETHKHEVALDTLEKTLEYLRSLKDKSQFDKLWDLQMGLLEEHPEPWRGRYLALLRKSKRRKN